MTARSSTARARRSAPRLSIVRSQPAYLAAEPVASPVIKWVGGKSKLLPELLARMPDTIGRYFEPFMGGAALFFRVAPERAVLSDYNADLVALYRAIAADATAVIKKLEKHRSLHDETYYYEMRSKWNDRDATWSDAKRAAAFIYLNKTCFNGLYRVNRSGDFNVPMGRYASPPICVPDTLRAAQTVLSRAELRCGDYRMSVGDAEKGDFLYFDPPYDPLTPTSNFTSYTESEFGHDQQRELAETARILVARGCKVMLSNSDTPFIRSIYKGFKIDRVKCSRAINSNAAKRGDVDEVIVVGGY